MPIFDILVFRNEMPTFADILAANQQLIKKYRGNQKMNKTEKTSGL